MMDLKGKKVAVFGGSGFIGGAIIRELNERGAHTWNFDISDKVFGDGNFRGDITKSQDVWLFLSLQRWDYIYILSAIAHMDLCQENPVETMRVNMYGLSIVLDAIRTIFSYENYIQKVVFASSVYAVDPSTPYGMSKFVGEKLIRWVFQNHSLRYLILRYGTVYGPGADDNNSMKKLIRKAMKDSIISYYGTGEECRDYIHISDAARASVDLLEKGGLFYIVGKDSFSAMDMCRRLREILAKDIRIECRGERPTGHYCYTANRYETDRCMKYSPACTIDFGDGLMDVIREIEKEP